MCRSRKDYDVSPRDSFISDEEARYEIYGRGHQDKAVEAPPGNSTKDFKALTNQYAWLILCLDYKGGPMATTALIRRIDKEWAKRREESGCTWTECAKIGIIAAEMGFRLEDDKLVSLQVCPECGGILSFSSDECRGHCTACNQRGQ